MRAGHVSFVARPPHVGPRRLPRIRRQFAAEREIIARLAHRPHHVGHHAAAVAQHRRDERAGLAGRHHPQLVRGAGDADLALIAKARGYKRGWVQHMLRERAARRGAAA